MAMTAVAKLARKEIPRSIAWTKIHLLRLPRPEEAGCEFCECGSILSPFLPLADTRLGVRMFASVGAVDGRGESKAAVVPFKYVPILLVPEPCCTTLI